LTVGTARNDIIVTSRSPEEDNGPAPPPDSAEEAAAQRPSSGTSPSGKDVSAHSSDDPLTEDVPPGRGLSVRAELAEDASPEEGPSVRLTSIEDAREKTRARLAVALIALLAITVLTIVVATVATSHYTVAEAVDLLGVVLAPLVGLVGAATGFYYGGKD